MDVVVLGCGLIGLACARELARRGHAVTVLDPGDPVRAASWAAAGMLAPRTEAVDGDAALLGLCDVSLALYPDFVAAVRDETGIDARLILDGITVAAFDEDGFSHLQARALELTACGTAHRLLHRDDLRAAEPALSRDALGALVIEGEGQVDNRLLGRALHAACLALGVRIVAGAGDVAVEADERRIRGVRTAYGFLAAPAVVNAAGAWSSRIGGLPEKARTRVFPIKGQMAAVEVQPGFLKRVTWAPGVYLVPRSDGRLLIGASVERAGFDMTVKTGTITKLLSAAIAAVPDLAECSIVETWAGLRPGSPDGRPLIGATALEGLFDATGHGRNGVLLTPVTAIALADVIEGRDVSRDVLAASPLRARAEGVCAPS